MEFLFRIIAFDLVLRLGILVRWMFYNLLAQLRSRPTLTYTNFQKRYAHSKDPSNHASNFLIHAIIGWGVVFAAVFVMVAVLD